MHAKNKTGFKSLDKIARHPSVFEIFQDDGIWIWLNEGWWTGPFVGTTQIHGDTVGEVIDLFRGECKPERKPA